MEAEISDSLRILEMCDRFHCLPSQLLAEDASVIRMLEIERRVRDRG